MNSYISSIVFLLLIFIIQTGVSFRFKLISLTNKYTYKTSHILNLKRDDNLSKDKEQDSFDIEFSREVESKLRNKFPDTPNSKSTKNNKKSNDDDNNDDNNTSFLDRNLLKGISKWEGLSRAVVAGFFVAG